MSNSTTKRKQTKPEKPTPGFPLFAHNNGLWAKKVRGRLRYFGSWSDPDGALEKWERQKDDLLAGREPREDDPDGMTVRVLANHFMTSKRRLVDAGELALRTFHQYHEISEYLIGHFGKNRLVDNLRPEDFAGLRAKLVKRFGSPQSLKVYIGKVKEFFRFAYDNVLVDRPVRFGSEFREPKQKLIDEHKNKKAEQMFERDEIHVMLDAAKPHQKAMILLAVNCGFGNVDLATLREPAIDFENGWVTHPRPKTAVHRRIPLWPETLQAIREATEARPTAKHKADADRVFLTRTGLPYVREKEIQSEKDAAKKDLKIRNAVTDEFTRYFKRLKINNGRGFYCLRHTCETIAGESRDQIAVDAIMGHRTPGQGTQYRERISDERLREVTDYVHDWLFPPEEGSK